MPLCCHRKGLCEMQNGPKFTEFLHPTSPSSRFRRSPLMTSHDVWSYIVTGLLSRLPRPCMHWLLSLPDSFCFREWCVDSPLCCSLCSENPFLPCQSCYRMNKECLFFSCTSHPLSFWSRHTGFLFALEWARILPTKWKQIHNTVQIQITQVIRGCWGSRDYMMTASHTQTRENAN